MNFDLNGHAFWKEESVWINQTAGAKIAKEIQNNWLRRTSWWRVPNQEHKCPFLHFGLSLLLDVIYHNLFPDDMSSHVTTPPRSLSPPVEHFVILHGFWDLRDIRCRRSLSRLVIRRLSIMSGFLTKIGQIFLSRERPLKSAEALSNSRRLLRSSVKKSTEVENMKKFATGRTGRKNKASRSRRNDRDRITRTGMCPHDCWTQIEPLV